MWTKTKAAAALAAMALTAPAVAAPVGPPTKPPARALLVSPLAIVEIDNLDFGSATTSPLSGTLFINATTGARTATGGVVPIASDPGQRAVFTAVGTAGRNVFINIQSPATLDNGFGDSLLVVALTIEGSPLKVIGPLGTITFGVGGIINVGPNQAEGVYSAEYDVVIDYF